MANHDPHFPLLTSPAPTNYILPLGLSRSRRGSLASLSSNTPADKEQLGKALDAIHNTARRTGTLTTFNEFSSPPAASSGSDAKGITGELMQNGLGGLLNRFKGAVSGSKDKQSSPLAKDDGKPQIVSIAANSRSNTPNSRTSLGPPKERHDEVTAASPGSPSVSSKLRSPTGGINDANKLDDATKSKPIQTAKSNTAHLRPLPSATSSPTKSRSRHFDLSTSDNDSLASSLQVAIDRSKGRSAGVTAPADHQGTHDPALLLQGHPLDIDSELSSYDGHDDEEALPSLEHRRTSSIETPSRKELTKTNNSDVIAQKDAIRPGTAARKPPPHFSKFEAPRDTSLDRSIAVANPINSPAHNNIRHGSFTAPDVQPRGSSGKDRIPGTTKDQGAPAIVSSKLEQMRKQVLSKEFWMADAICKECFLCGHAFTAFRRKHHCRTCGCIFDSKCTSIVSGDRFGVHSKLRVCRTCLDIINRRHDSSGSDDSGDDGFLPTSFFPSRAQQAISTDHDSAPSAIQLKPNEPDNKVVAPQEQTSRTQATPMMAIPAARRIGDAGNRRSAVLEIDAPQLPRPGSSRSLKSMTGLRPPSSNHRRHQSKNSFLQRFRGNVDQRPPFHKDPRDERKRSRMSAFHDDNIIDPDLAPFMSDEGSTDEEQMSLVGALNGDTVTSPNYENERAAFGSLVAAGKRSRRPGDKSGSGVSFVNRGMDETVLSTSYPRSNRRRNVSASSNAIHLSRASPRHGKTSSIHKGAGTWSEDINVPDSQFESSSPRPSSRMTRSISMRNDNAPAIELNHASLVHVRKLLHQMLEDYNIPNVPSWEKAMIPILLRVTDDVNPDVRAGDAIDIRHYVKLKKIPGGKPGDTSYVSGVVFAKNLALKSMSRSITNPRIVLISFAIEYAKKQQHFMSIEPVIAQEANFLKNMVARIVSLRPQLVLVQKNISGLALQYLQEANVAVAYNVKQSVMEAVSRFTRTEIISSIDMVTLKPVHVGKSQGFDVKTYVHSDIPGKKKTCMQISGCPKELGCTIVLRGAPLPILSKMKRITEFMVYVVYNLKLETCLMRDEFVIMPASNSDRAATPKKPVVPVDVRLQKVAETGKVLQQMQRDSQHPACSGSADSFTPLATPAVEYDRELDHFTETSAVNDPEHESSENAQDDTLLPTFYSEMVAKHETKILSASPFVKFMQPYLLMRAREQERRLNELRRLRDQHEYEEAAEIDSTKPQKFQLILPEMVHASNIGASRQIRDVLHAVHDAEYDKALYTYEKQKRQWEIYLQGSVNLFDPYSHQNIVVLYTVVCTTTTVPCAGPDIIAFSFYNEMQELREWYPDCTLGQFVEDLCSSVDDVCTSNGCERKMSEHHRAYVHGEARITVFMEKAQCKIKGLHDSILMWSYCKICKKETGVMPMSESTWKYSFGKYLELAFWTSGIHLRPGVCPHDLHRDHIRYFGYRNVNVRVHYDPIDLLEIIVPRSRVTWKVENDLRLKNDLFLKTEERWNRFMASVQSRIKGINIDGVVPEKVESCKAEIERLGKRAQDEHALLLRKLQEKYTDSKYYEIVPLNRAVRAMQEKVAQWDAAFADFDADFFPSEKDIRRLAALQLRKMFMDRDSSSTSLTSVELTERTPMSESQVVELESSTPSDVEDSLQSVLEQDNNGQMSDLEDDGVTPIIEKLQAIEHLDLAVDADKIQALPPLPLDVAEPQDSLEKEPEVSGSAPEVMISCAAEGQQAIKNMSSNNMEPQVDAQIPMSPTTLLEESFLDESLLPTPTQTRPIEDLRPAARPKPITTPLEGSLTERLLHLRNTNLGSSEIPPAPGASSIPRPSLAGVNIGSSLGTAVRRARSPAPPPVGRTQSGPTVPRRLSALASKGFGKQGEMSRLPTPSEELPDPFNSIMPELKDRKLSDRLGINTLKRNGKSQSMIPRSISGKRKESKVSTLARHFEQLSREFEKERLRDRKARAAKSAQSRAFPKAFAKPIVDVYKDVNEAVEEIGPSDDYIHVAEPDSSNAAEESSIAGGYAQDLKDKDDDTRPSSPTSTADLAEETSTETETGDEQANGSGPPSDDEYEGGNSIGDGLPDISDIADRIGSDVPSTELGLPKHEKMGYLKMLTNFWAERSASGWTQLDYPLNMTDHVFVDSDVIVREDEPSSLIAFALSSDDYLDKLHHIRQQGQALSKERDFSDDGRSTSPDASMENINQAEVEKSLLRATGTHLKYQYAEGTARMLCKIFYTEQFEAIRRSCGVGDRIIESLSRCAKWDSKGGKTKSVFLKTLDDRLVLKSLSPVETQAFLRFAPAYFNLMAEALYHELPTAIAKMLGFYQIVIKNPATGTEIKWDLLIMENLFYDRSGCRTFDLKGSMRNRKIQSTGQSDEVLLDENMVEYVYENPLFAREHSKKLLKLSVWNDTLFLARQNVMDYSLMVAVDEERKELVVGVIDCIRTYTWDKKLETWIKDRGFAGGGRNRPTVTSPKEYKSRFREAMGRYILQAPK